MNSIINEVWLIKKIGLKAPIIMQFDINLHSKRIHKAVLFKKCTSNACYLVATPQEDGILIHSGIIYHFGTAMRWWTQRDGIAILCEVNPQDLSQLLQRHDIEALGGITINRGSAKNQSEALGPIPQEHLPEVSRLLGLKS